MPPSDDSATLPAPFADAVRVPESYRRGDSQLDRIDSVLAVAEPLLGRKPTDNHAFIRRQGGVEKMFVTMKSSDTIYFPKTHPREGQPRYRWVDGDGGIELGYLVEKDA